MGERVAAPTLQDYLRESPRTPWLRGERPMAEALNQRADT